MKINFFGNFRWSPLLRSQVNKTSVVVSDVTCWCFVWNFIKIVQTEGFYSPDCAEMGRPQTVVTVQQWSPNVHQVLWPSQNNLKLPLNFLVPLVNLKTFFYNPIRDFGPISFSDGFSCWDITFFFLVGSFTAPKRHLDQVVGACQCWRVSDYVAGSKFSLKGAVRKKRIVKTIWTLESRTAARCKKSLKKKNWWSKNAKFASCITGGTTHRMIWDYRPRGNNNIWCFCCCWSLAPPKRTGLKIYMQDLPLHRTGWTRACSTWTVTDPHSPFQLLGCSINHRSLLPFHSLAWESFSVYALILCLFSQIVTKGRGHWESYHFTTWWHHLWKQRRKHKRRGLLVL